MHHMYETGPVAPWQLDALFQIYGARLTEDLGQVNFAARCLMRNKLGIHLVLPGAVGPVTVFFMPAETPSTRLQVADKRFTGLVQPTSWGSVAVIGEVGEALDGVARRVLDAVVWPAPLAGRAADAPFNTPRA
jgi:hypothetical protein